MEKEHDREAKSRSPSHTGESSGTAAHTEMPLPLAAQEPGSASRSQLPSCPVQLVWLRRRGGETRSALGSGPTVLRFLPPHTFQRRLGTEWSPVVNGTTADLNASKRGRWAARQLGKLPNWRCCHVRTHPIHRRGCFQGRAGHFSEARTPTSRHWQQRDLHCQLAAGSSTRRSHRDGIGGEVSRIAGSLGEPSRPESVGA